MAITKITGFWTFFCNPKYWEVDVFLAKHPIGKKSQYRIASWQKDFFEAGQLGVIRVGVDTRTKAQLNGKKKLNKGIYAIVEIMGKPTVPKIPKFKIAGQLGERTRYSVPIKYVKNYIHQPILLSEIEHDYIIQCDRYLLNGIQAASMPLLEDTFNRLLLYGEEKLAV